MKGALLAIGLMCFYACVASQRCPNGDFEDLLSARPCLLGQIFDSPITVTEYKAIWSKAGVTNCNDMCKFTLGLQGCCRIQLLFKNEFSFCPSGSECVCQPPNLFNAPC
uniref:Uncharacterized protein n=1 Tax=Acrobeloides nanus TaxID=290746 RepID=A0A914CTA6_9BILA